MRMEQRSPQTKLSRAASRNISGTVTSIDTAASTLTVKDLITKKPVTIHITPDVQMRRLPDMMSRMIAARLEGICGRARRSNHDRASARWCRIVAQPTGRYGCRTRGDAPAVEYYMEQALDRAPAIQLGDLQKGEAVMLVATQGKTDVNAIKLLAGVEPLLEAPAASPNLLSSWSMGSGGADAGAARVTELIHIANHKKSSEEPVHFSTSLRHSFFDCVCTWCCESGSACTNGPGHCGNFEHSWPYFRPDGRADSRREGHGDHGRWQDRRHGNGRRERSIHREWADHWKLYRSSGISGLCSVPIAGDSGCCRTKQACRYRHGD